MTRIPLLALLLLSACANNRYTVIAGGPGSQTDMQSALSDCRYASMQQAAAAQNHGALFVGAVLGGMAGAVAGSLIDGPAQPHVDVNQLIEACMRDRGYDGTSEN